MFNRKAIAKLEKRILDLERSSLVNGRIAVELLMEKNQLEKVEDPKPGHAYYVIGHNGMVGTGIASLWGEDDNGVDVRYAVTDDGIPITPCTAPLQKRKQ